MVRRRLVLSTLISLAAALGVAPAQAAPPEGCIGFPSIPDAYVCITQFTPQNALPAAGLGPNQTYTIPEFCVFECFGPTPVNVPSVTVTPGGGVLVTVVYRGQAHTVTAPTATTVVDAITLVQQTAVNAVATTLALAGKTAADAAGAAQGVVGGLSAGLLHMQGRMTIARFGQGDTYGVLDGSITGLVYGRTFVNEPLRGTFSMSFPWGLCPAEGSWYGMVTFGGATLGTTWTMFAGSTYVSVWTSDGYRGSGYGTFTPTTAGVVCGANNVTAAVTAAVWVA